MENDFIIDDYKNDYFQGIQSLFKIVFDKDLSDEYFNWKNEINPSGNSIIKVTTCDGNIIGYSCIMKFKIQFLGRDILAGQPVDAMVAKDFRRKNIYENMAIKAFDDINEQGLALRFNFPNYAAFMASTKRVNIKKVCDVPQFLKILDGPAAVQMFTNNKLLGFLGGKLQNTYSRLRSIGLHNNQEYEIREIQHFDSNFDGLWDDVKHIYPIAVIRSSQYLNWRYTKDIGNYKIFAVYKSGELAGYIVGRTENRAGKGEKALILGHIADIICQEKYADAVSCLIAAMENHFKDVDACAISCWMLKHWFYAKILNRHGFLQFRSPALLAAIPMGDKIAEKDSVYKLENWFITIGDSDYI